MFPFIVLVTKHVWNERHTSQFDVATWATSINYARDNVRMFYPAQYINGVAYFTGEIFCL